ncbi:MAG: site-specific integrase, partial [Chloroflexi bacterium]|nr:site-specific integrase [Chloroflexota bacterium]
MTLAPTERRAERIEAEDLLDTYLIAQKARKNLSDYTLRNYANDLRQFFDYLDEGRRGLRTVDRLLVREYLSSLVASGLASGSVSRKVSTLRVFYRYLRNEDVLDADPMLGVRGPKKEQRLPRFLTQGEIETLINAADKETPQGLRDRAILELLYAAGLRVSEVVGVEVANVDLDDQTARVFGKGARERLVMM